jgi:hypothetical protein
VTVILAGAYEIERTDYVVFAWWTPTRCAGLVYCTVLAGILFCIGFIIMAG